MSGLLLTFFRKLTKVKYENTCKGKPGNSSFRAKGLHLSSSKFIYRQQTTALAHAMNLSITLH